MNAVLQMFVNDAVAIDGPAPLNYILFVALAVYVLIAHFTLKVVPAAGPKAPDGKLAGIEGVRGVLAFIVLISHYILSQRLFIDGSFKLNFPDIERLGTLGCLAVAFFFQITGYLFWTKYLVDPKLDTQRLFHGRIARIGPALCATYAVVAAILLFAGSQFDAGWTPEKLGSFLSIFSIGGYRIDYNRWVILLVGPTWTLKWELIFYAVLPFMFAFRQFAGPIAIHIVTPFLLYFRLPDRSATQFWLPGNALLYIWSGALVAECAALIQRADASNRQRLDGALTFAAPLIFTFVFLRGDFDFAATQIPLVALTMLGLARGSTFFGLLRLGVFQELGKISYSTYLTHGVVIMLALNAIDLWAPVSAFSEAQMQAALIVLMPIVVIVSTLSYRYCERPYMMRDAARSRAKSGAAFASGPTEGAIR